MQEFSGGKEAIIMVGEKYGDLLLGEVAET